MGRRKRRRRRCRWSRLSWLAVSPATPRRMYRSSEVSVGSPSASALTVLQWNGSRDSDLDSRQYARSSTGNTARWQPGTPPAAAGTLTGRPEVGSAGTPPATAGTLTGTDTEGTATPDRAPPATAGTLAGTETDGTETVGTAPPATFGTETDGTAGTETDGTAAPPATFGTPTGTETDGTAAQPTGTAGIAAPAAAEETLFTADWATLETAATAMGAAPLTRARPTWGAA
jgi:hypothetical protein